VASRIAFLGLKLVVLAWLQATFAREMWISFTDIVERARQQDCRQAAKRHGRQHLGKQIALRLVKYL
jgi:hypothetical protein